MAEDPKISQRYRELGREEPPRELDARILAAARRAAETRPAPLVVPSGRRRWYFPLAAAAIIVLAVAVTIHVEREQPDPEMAVPPVSVPETLREEQPVQSGIAKEPAKPAPARKAAPPRVFAPDPKPQPAPAESVGAASAPPVAAPPPTPSRAERSDPSAAAASRSDELRAQREAELRAQRDAASEEKQVMARAETARSAAMARVETPEKWLERIAELRRQGRHEEADKALAEFRKRYPDYKISGEMLEKVEKK